MNPDSGFIVVIPARMASTRLPGKMLLDIAGKPLLQHVYERCCQSQAEQVIIATDHSDIEQRAKAFSASVCMTASSHQSGTERIAEVIERFALPPQQIIVNVQGDEPLLDPTNIDQVAKMLAECGDFDVTTLFAPIKKVQQVFDPNIVKVVTDQQGRALYFSRAPIPWNRARFDWNKEIDQLDLDAGDYKKHIGLYAYRAQFVKQYVSLAPQPLEGLEVLEQLRVLESGYRIGVASACSEPGIGVDTEEDLQQVRELLGQRE